MTRVTLVPGGEGIAIELYGSGKVIESRCVVFCIALSGQDSASFGAGLRAVHAERCYRSGPQMLPLSEVIGAGDTVFMRRFPLP